MRYLNLCSISFPLPLVLAALFVMGGVSQTARGQSLADFGEFYLSNIPAALWLSISGSYA